MLDSDAELNITQADFMQEKNERNWDTPLFSANSTSCTATE